jgi:hypothetical protein
MQRFLRLLRSNWLSAAGGVITTLSFMAFVSTLVYVALHGYAHGRIWVCSRSCCCRPAS